MLALSQRCAYAGCGKRAMERKIPCGRSCSALAYEAGWSNQFYLAQEFQPKFQSQGHPVEVMGNKFRMDKGKLSLASDSG